MARYRPTYLHVKKRRYVGTRLIVHRKRPKRLNPAHHTFRHGKGQLIRRNHNKALAAAVARVAGQRQKAKATAVAAAKAKARRGSVSHHRKPRRRA